MMLKVVLITALAAFAAGWAVYKHRKGIKTKAQVEAREGMNFLQREEERLKEGIKSKI